MTLETVSIATEPTEAGPTDDTKPAEGAPVESQDAEGSAPEGGSETDEAKAKPEKTPEQREIDRLRRGIDRRTRQLAEARAQAGLTRQPIAQNNGAQQDDSETLSLTRAQIAELVKAEAEKLAPTVRQQAAEVERRQGVIQSLAKTWGQEKFDTLSSDLDDAFGGLTDSSGKPKPAIEAVFESDNPGAVIEFLADPDNADEAERIARLSPVQAGKAVAKLELQLSARAAQAKPKPSNAPAPLEPLRGKAPSAAPDPSDTKAWIKFQNEQDRKGN